MTTEQSTATTRKKAPAKRKAATKRTAKPRARKPAARKVGEAAYIEETLESLRNVMLASLGAYGEAVDELKARLDATKKDSSTRYDKWVARGEKIQKETKGKISDFEIPKPDVNVKDNLDKMREGINDLLDTLFTKEEKKKKPARKKAA
jgi:hypothetical protein